MQEFKRKKVFFLTWLFLLNFTYFSLMLSSTLEQIRVSPPLMMQEEKKKRGKKSEHKVHTFNFTTDILTMALNYKQDKPFSKLWQTSV